MSSQVTWDHVGVHGLARDLAVAEKIAGERRLGREEEEPDTRVPLSVTQRLPPLFYLNSRFLASLQKSYLRFLSSKSYETNFMMIHGMTSF